MPGRRSWTPCRRPKRSAWLVVYTAVPSQLRDDVLVLSFPSQSGCRRPEAAHRTGEGVGDYLKNAVVEVLGFRPSWWRRSSPRRARPGRRDHAGGASRHSGTGAVLVRRCALARLPDRPTPPTPSRRRDRPRKRRPRRPPPRRRSCDAERRRRTEQPRRRPGRTRVHAGRCPRCSARDVPPARQRYGESVVREILGASFIEEQPYAAARHPEGRARPCTRASSRS